MAPRRILFVDDSEDLREWCAVILRSAGYEVVVAEDGQAALAEIAAHRPALIITDVSMPRMDGFELLVRLRSDLAPPLPPIIVCSGFDQAEEQARALGASCFLAKPTEPAVLLQVVSSLLDGATAVGPLVAAQWNVAHEVRARAAAAAARLSATLAAAGVDVEERLARFVQVVADYLDVAPALIAVADEGRVRIAAASSGSPIPAGITLTGDLLYSTGVLAAGASLILPDARGLGLAADPRARSLGFVVAVPLAFEGTPIGALSLVGPTPRPFCADDLSTLEAIGGRASHELDHGPRASEHVGLWPPELFDRAVANELSILHRERGGFDFVLVDVDDQPLDPQQLRALVARAGSRFAVSRCGERALALFKRDPDASVATRVIADTISVLFSDGHARAAGWVSVVDERLPAVSRNVVRQLASSALDDARRAPGRPIARLTLAAGDASPPVTRCDAGAGA